MTKSGSGAPRPRPVSAAAGRPGTLTSSQRSQAVRMNLFVLVRILFQYLERVDRGILDLAKEVLKDCERKHNTQDSKYDTLADAISERVRDAVGEAHWSKARQIQKQLAVNQQRKRMQAMAEVRKRQGFGGGSSGRKPGPSRPPPGPSVLKDTPRFSSQPPPSQPPKRRPSPAANSAEALEVARTMAGLSRQGNATPPSSNTSTDNLCTASGSVDPGSVDREMSDAPSATSADNDPSRPPEAGGKHGLSNREEEGERPPPSAEGGGGEGGSHLPLRKRITFAPPTFEPNASAAGSADSAAAGSNPESSNSIGEASGKSTPSSG